MNIIRHDNKQKIIDFTKKYGRSVHIIHLDDVSEFIDFDFDTNGWSSIVLARLFLDKLLPDNINRILYLDGDTLVLKDLSRFYNIDLGDNVLGMCPEPTVDKGRREFLALREAPYHNSGVLLIDLKQWRNREIGKKVIDFYKELKEKNTDEIIFFDVPLLFESGIDKFCDKILVVISDYEIQLNRIVERDKIDRELASKIIKSQLSNEERIKKADVVIENNSSLEDLFEKIERFCEEI